MRVHAPPTHIGYRTKRWIVLSTTQVVSLAAAGAVGLALWGWLGTLPALAGLPLVRIGIVAGVTLCLVLAALVEIATLVSDALRWRRTVKRTTYRVRRSR